MLAVEEGEDIFLTKTGGENGIPGGVDADQFWIVMPDFSNNPQTIEDLELDIDEIVIAEIHASSTTDLNFSQNGNDAIISFSATDLAVFLATDVNQLENNGIFRFI